jgi:hypothetical protein
MPRRFRPTIALLIALPLLAAALAHAAPARLTPDEAAAWREDLKFLATELPRRHPMPFEGRTRTRVTRAQFDSAVTELDARIPALARHEVIVGLQRIVAMLGAGHTTLSPFLDPSVGFRQYPVELYAFRDGMFVIRADSAHRDLVGARVVRVGALAPDSALARVATVLSHENEWFLRAHGVTWLMMPEVAGALGIAPDMERLALTVERDGRQRTVTLAPAGGIRGSHDNPLSPDRTGWVDMRPASVPPPLWRSRHTPRWLEYLPDRRTLYVSFQSLAPSGHGEPVDAFVSRVLAGIDSLAPERVVLDVRANLGGNSFFNLPLVTGLIRRTRVDQKGRLFAIIGRNTYSAAQNLVNELERYTQVTFVGEPTGAPPASFGDHVPVRLPRSGLHVFVSTLWWQTMNPADRRAFVPPAIYAEPTAADYRQGVDPALAAVWAYQDQPSLETRLTEAVARGDTALALRIVAGERDRIENRYVNLEAKVNALGYALLNSGQPERAVQVMTVNARAWPQSANVHDSLGEVLEHAGRRDEAIAAYRRALAIRPGFPSPREGLQRLGAAPH